MMIALLVVISSVLALAIYRKSSSLIETTYHTVSQNSLIAYSDVLDLRLSFLIDRVRSHLLSATFYDNFTAADSSNPVSFGAAATFRANSILNRLLLEESLFSGLWIFNLDDARLSAGVSNRPDLYNFEYDSGLIDTDADWYQKTLAANGKELFFGYNVLQQSDESTLSMTKLLRRTDTFERIGILVATMDKRMLDDLSANWNIDQETSMMIVDEEKGDCLIFCNQPCAQEVLSHYLLWRERNEGGDYLFQTHCSSLSRWSFISFIPRNQLSSIGQYLQSYLVIVFSGILFLGLLISFVLTHILYRPIERLKVSIQQFERDSLPITANFDNSEIGEISNTIKKAINQNLELSKRLKDAEVREKEAELRLLQAQINPHFLYNTLDSLYLMAITHDVDEIAEMTAALSDIFKITLSKGNRYIRLEDELEYIRQYILIQNIRFSNRFRLEINAEPEACQCFMLKLLIQPFVENAVYHGLEPKIGNGFIRIDAHIHDGHLLISITDDGIGVQDPASLDSGYGIRNVRERIHLFYGPEYDVVLHSEFGKGTSVSIRLPILEEARFRSGARYSDLI